MMALLAEDAFRMKLHALKIPVAVADPHNLSAGAAGGDDKLGGSVGGSITSE